MNTTIDAIVANTEYRKPPVDSVRISVERLGQCSDVVDAYLLSLDVSGRERKEVAADIGISVSALHRILNRDTEGSERRFMQGETLLQYMLACRNSIPLQWMMYRFSFFTGFVTLPGGEQLRVVDGLPIFSRADVVDELRDVKVLLEELFETRRKLRSMGEACSVSMDPAAQWLFAELIRAELEVGR